ncbi:MAG: NAD(P)H-dependent oxidoreductase [Spirochaetes bacterium]|nr:NAD(P)H-dependent oxidoreductase [Spirochaetota bacterium]
MAFPLYFFGFPATVKNVIDRLFILLESPQIIGNCGTTCHPIRFDRHPKTVLISSCGFPEIEHFDIVRRHFKKICDEAGWPLAGEILISAAGAVDVPGLFDKKLNFIKEAGSAFMQSDIGRDIQEEISKPVISDRDYREMVTAALKGGITGRIKSTVIGTKAIIKSKME